MTFNEIKSNIFNALSVPVPAINFQTQVDTKDPLNPKPTQWVSGRVNDLRVEIVMHSETMSAILTAKAEGKEFAGLAVKPKEIIPAHTGTDKLGNAKEIAEYYKYMVVIPKDLVATL